MGPTQFLVRFGHTPDGTLGRLGPWCVLEEEEQGNRRNVSRIPAGQYVCQRSLFRGRETFEVLNVPGRSGIKFHWGNTEEDTEGCPLLGDQFGVLEVEDEDTGEVRPKLAVLRSNYAFTRWIDSLEGVDSFVLVVVEV